MKGIAIRERLESLVSLRKTLDDTLQAIEKFVVPYRGEFFKPMTSELEIEWRRRKIYDSTAINAANLLASQIHANLTSPSIRWFEFTFRDKSLNSGEAKRWLEAAQRICWQTLIESDFNMEIAECYLDMVAYGTSVLFEEEMDETQWAGVNFTALPIQDCYFEHGADDRVMRVYRVLRFTALALEDRFDLPAGLARAISESKDVDEKHRVIFCVYVRPENEDVDITKRLAPEARPVGYKYIYAQDGSELEEGGYYEMPAFVVRWQKVAGSRWGFGPAHTCLSDILQLNEVVAQTSESRAKAIDPPMMTTERGIISDLDLTPGGLTVVTSMEELAPYPNIARFDQADAEIDRLQQSIRSTFYVDKLELKESPAMTATEVMVRYERMQRQFAPTLGRLQADLLDPLLQKTLRLLYRAGQLPEIPAEALGADLDIEYTAPIPRAQKNEVAQATSVWVNELGALSQVIPDILDIVDTDTLARELGMMRGVPADMMNTAEEVQQMRADRAELEQQQQQLALLEQAGNAASAVGEGMEGIEGNA